MTEKQRQQIATAEHLHEAAKSRATSGLQHYLLENHGIDDSDCFAEVASITEDLVDAAVHKALEQVMRAADSFGFTLGEAVSTGADLLGALRKIYELADDMITADDSDVLGDLDAIRVIVVEQLGDPSTWPSDGVSS